MLIDRSHRSWFSASLAFLAGSSILYLLPIHGDHAPRGGSTPGLIYGILGLAMMLFAGLIGARRLKPSWRLGSAQFWLRGHIWLGLLSFPMVLMHSGFGWGGPVEIVLWLLFLGVLVTGIVGLAFQQVLPSMLRQLPLETFREQVPYILKWNLFLADRSLSLRCGRLHLPRDVLFESAKSLIRDYEGKKGPIKTAPATSPAGKASPLAAARLAASSAPIAEAASARPTIAKHQGPQAGGPAAAVSSAAAAPAAVVPATAKPIAAKLAVAKAAGEPSPAPARAAAPAHAAAAPAEAANDKWEWLSSLGKPEQVLFRRLIELAMTEKQRGGWTKLAGRETNFPLELALVYDVHGSADTAEPQRPEARALRSAYIETIRPFLSAGRPRRMELLYQHSMRELNRIESISQPEMAPVFRRLSDACEQRRQLFLQLRNHGWLHSWQLIHIPLSMALLLLVFVHVVMALRVIPF